MRRMLPPIVGIGLMICILGAFLVAPVQAQPPGWSGDDNFAFLLEVDGISAVDSDAANPIPVNLSESILLELSIDVSANMTIVEGVFSLLYLSIPIFSQPVFNNTLAPAGVSLNLINSSVSLADLIGPGIDLISGTIEGVFAITYSLWSSPSNTTSVSDNFVLRIGPQGTAALGSLPGLITIGFAVMSIFSLLKALEEFQKGIFAASKMRSGKTPKGVEIFPAAVVLRRKPGGKEKLSKDDLIARVGSAIQGADSVAKHAPKAMNIVTPKSKVPVGKLSKALKVKRDVAGRLAAAMTEAKIFQTRSVKTPTKKVAFSGMTLAGIYWSVMQLLGNAAPDLLTMALTLTGALVISVVIGYFMGWLSRIPKMGYDN
ncbi:MAG: hypothetical protein P1Q69_01635 [Candidatus Thorarchaeota archaeon]|nr:hypothetical protein [Candidatus Thorarchaeota archaeon]